MFCVIWPLTSKSVLAAPSATVNTVLRLACRKSSRVEMTDVMGLARELMIVLP